MRNHEAEALLDAVILSNKKKYPINSGENAGKYEHRIFLISREQLHAAVSKSLLKHDSIPILNSFITQEIKKHTLHPFNQG